jgi:hypothetical protein
MNLEVIGESLQMINQLENEREANKKNHDRESRKGSKLK